jgi:hypothetical protein
MTGWVRMKLASFHSCPLTAPPSFAAASG